MNKDARLIFENYAKTLSVAVADSSAGLPIGKKPFDEDAEISPKKLVKKISNLPLLHHYFEDEILRSIEDAAGELTMANAGPQARVENPTAADLAIYQNLDKWSGPNPIGHETIDEGVQKLLDTFSKDLTQKVAKEYIKKYAYEDAAKYRRDNVDRTGTTNPENFKFLPGGDIYVKDEIMRQAVPRELAPEKPEGRVVDYQWKEVADYDPKKVYWNPSSHDDQRGLSPVEAHHQLNNIFEEFFGEGYDFRHFVDVLVNSGFEDPLKIMESLLRNPNIEKIRDLFARHDKWRTERKKEQLKRGSQEGEDYVTVKKYPNGYTWRQMISRAGCEREGALQDHCVGDYNPTRINSRIFALVDNKGDSHITIQVGQRFWGTDQIDDIQQIKGKRNSKPKPEYIPYIEDFISNKGGLPDARFGEKVHIGSGPAPTGKRDFSALHGFSNTGGIETPGPIVVTNDGENIGWEFHQEHSQYYPKGKAPSFTEYYDWIKGKVVPAEELEPWRSQNQNRNE